MSDGGTDGGLSHELGAAVSARKDLGEPYESALVASFLEKIDREVDVRVAERLAGLRPARPDAPPAPARGAGVALGSIALGIPVSAVVASLLHGVYGFLGIVVAWGAIATVNAAHAFGSRRR